MLSGVGAILENYVDLYLVLRPVVEEVHPEIGPGRLSGQLGSRTSRVGAGVTDGTHASVASSTPSRIATMTSFSTVKLMTAA